MADFQYLPDMDDPVTKLRMAMEKLDGAYSLRNHCLLAHNPCSGLHPLI